MKSNLASETNPNKEEQIPKKQSMTTALMQREIGMPVSRKLLSDFVQSKESKKYRELDIEMLKETIKKRKSAPNDTDDKFEKCAENIFKKVKDSVLSNEVTGAEYFLELSLGIKPSFISNDYDKPKFTSYLSKLDSAKKLKNIDDFTFCGISIVTGYIESGFKLPNYHSYSSIIRYLVAYILLWDIKMKEIPLDLYFMPRDRIKCTAEEKYHALFIFVNKIASLGKMGQMELINAVREITHELSQGQYTIYSPQRTRAKYGNNTGFFQQFIDFQKQNGAEFTLNIDETTRKRFASLHQEFEDYINGYQQALEKSNVIEQKM